MDPTWGSSSPFFIAEEHIGKTMGHSYQSGKAMLSVEKDGDDLFVSGFPLTGVNTNGARQWFDDDMELLVYCDWLPAQCKRMEHGDKMIFKITFEQSYYYGTWGYDDDDQEFIIHRAVKLYHRRGAQESRRSLKKYYQSKTKNRR